MMVYSAAIMMGLFSAPHCVAMCGGLASAMGLTLVNETSAGRFIGILKYNAGRLCSYSLLGGLVGLLGAGFVELLPNAALILRLIAGLLLIFSGLYISGIWLGLRHLEQALFSLSNKLQQIFGQQRLTGRPKLLLAGMAWGCLPCGLVFSALTMAMSQQGPWQGALFMLSFGLGTLPVLFGVGMASSTFGQWLRLTAVKMAAGILLVGYGLWTLNSLAGMTF